jgi:uncharacterized protein
LVIASYVLLSAVGALLVGILGTGSALLLLPSLTLIFTTTMPDAEPLRLAAGTTMATIAVGAIAGAIAQHRLGQVDARLLRLMLPPYVVGGLAGPWLGRLLPTQALHVYVAGLIVLVAVLMLRSGGSSARNQRDFDSHRVEMRIVLLAIGVASSAAGVASGIFAIPYLTRFTVPWRAIMGTSTAAAAVYAVCGALGYLTAGWSVPGRPPGSVGFVYLPAFFVMAITATVMTPLGVKLAKHVSERLLRRCFALFLIVVSIALLVY